MDSVPAVHFDLIGDLISNSPIHMSWWGVGSTAGNANFGQITSATYPRTVQFGLRLQF